MEQREIHYHVVQRTTAPADKLHGPFSVSDRFLAEVKLQFGSSVDVYVKVDTVAPAGVKDLRSEKATWVLLEPAGKGDELEEDAA